MLSKHLRIILYNIVILSIIFTNIAVLGNLSVFRPPDNTISEYTWSFDGFASIVTLNGTHIDYNSQNVQLFETANPTFANFTVRYSTYNGFVEEHVTGKINNDTHSFAFSNSFLINASTREYVNEQGISLHQYANGYIDPSGDLIGTQINTSSLITNVTSLESITVAGSNRMAWKLEFRASSVNSLLNTTSVNTSHNATLYYDKETGLLLKFYFETLEGSVGSPQLQKLDSPQSPIDSTKTIRYTQELVSTNAWNQSSSQPSTETISSLDWVSALMVITLFSLIFSKNRKKRD